MIRTILAIALLLSLLAGIRLVRSTPHDCSRCNVIIIAVDPLRGDRLHHVGYHRPITPELDRMAASGISFSRAYSPAPWGIPAYASLLTGLYPVNHGLVHAYRYRDDTTPSPANFKNQSSPPMTLAEYLQSYGYATAGFTGSPALNRQHGFATGFGSYEDTESEYLSVNRAMSRASAWLKNRPSGPFFLFIHGSDLDGEFDHQFTTASIDPNPVTQRSSLTGSVEEYLQLKSESFFRRSPIIRSSLPHAVGSTVNNRLLRQYQLTETDRQKLVDVYDLSVSETDAAIGKFLADLDATGISARSIILVTSGYGTEIVDHGGIGYGQTLYEEVVRIPLILRIPDNVSGIVSDVHVSLIDILPTVLDLVGIDTDTHQSGHPDGMSLVPLLAGKRLTERHLFFETDYTSTLHTRAVLSPDDWKFILTMETGERQGYDLTKDPIENDNTYQNHASQSVTSEFAVRRFFFAGSPFTSQDWGSYCQPELDQVCDGHISHQ